MTVIAPLVAFAVLMLGYGIYDNHVNNRNESVRNLQKRQEQLEKNQRELTRILEQVLLSDDFEREVLVKRIEALNDEQVVLKGA